MFEISKPTQRLMKTALRGRGDHTEQQNRNSQAWPYMQMCKICYKIKYVNSGVYL